MLGVVVAAVLSGRRRDVLASIAAAAIVVGVRWPGVALDLSFQLSFAAVLTLALAMEGYWRWWSAFAEARLLHLRGRGYRWLGWALASVAVNLSALAGTAPLTALHFNQVPLVALAANPLVVPLVGTVAVALGLLGAVAALFAEAPARLFLQGAGIAAAAGAGFMASLPGAGARVVTPSTGELCLLYAALAAALGLSGRRRRRVIAVLALLLALDAGWALRERWYRRDLRVTFLSVGQGDATVIEFPGSSVMVVDGGGLYGLDAGERVVAPQLWRRRIGRVDIVVMTHPDFDHYGGLEYLVRHFEPREFWHSGATSTAASFQSLMVAVRGGRGREVVVRSGDRREIGGCPVEVLWPGAPRGRRANDDSVVLRVECGGVSVLLPGDLEAGGESALVARGIALGSDVLKGGHHGSATSSTPRFLAAVRPRAVVLSAGWANRFGFPDLRVLARLERAGATVYRTDRDGAVVLRGRGAEGYVIETGRATDVDSPGGGVYRFESDRGDASGIPERPLF
jgi:competence protein ComEC